MCSSLCVVEHRFAPDSGSLQRGAAVGNSLNAPTPVQICTSWASLPPVLADELDWNDLRYFLRAAELGSLAAAARSLGVEHTTVGRRLSALERALGAPLVVRGPEGLRLTPVGQKLLPLVAEVARGIEQARALVASEKSRVRLAMPSGFSRLFAPELGRLQQQHPGLSLELLSGARPVDLALGEADLALRGGTIVGKDLISRKLGSSGWALYASPAYLGKAPQGVDLEDLSGHDLIGFDPSLADGPAAKWLAERTGSAQIVMRGREMVDMLAAAQSGVGLVLLPCFLGDADTELVRLSRGVVASHGLSLVYRREARISKEVRAVIRFVAEVIEKHASALSGVRGARS
jgi:DNA-binding transcriptional LysR family regulator